MSLNQMLKFCSVLVLFSKGRRLTLALLLALTGLVADMPLMVHAQDFTVNSVVDREDANQGDGKCDTGNQVSGQPECSLRAAVEEANALLSSPHTITIPAGTYNLSTASACKFYGVGNSNLSSQTRTALCLRGNMTLNGAGAAKTILDGGLADRVFIVSADATSAINGVTVQNGLFSSSDYVSCTGGGGIDNEGALSISSSIFTSNSSISSGGAICNPGTLNVSGSSFMANSATQNAGEGGAISSYGTISIDQSTLTYNTARLGGALVLGASASSARTSASITNSTMANNTSSAGGAAIFADYTNYRPSDPTGVLITNVTIANNLSGGVGAIYFGNFSQATLRNVTIAQNSAGPYAGGIYSNGKDASLQILLYNTLIAGNTTQNAAENNCVGYYISNGHSLIGAQDELSQGDQQKSLCHLAGPATNLMGVDARLGELADNGGQTQTVGLKDSSPAIDAGSPAAPGSGDATACPLFDQRGYLRPLGSACDIGAVERSKDFRLATVLPAAVGDSGLSLLTLSGDGFAPGASLKLSRSGQSDLIAKDVTVDSAGSSASTFIDFSGAHTGPWDVTLTNSNGGTVSLPGGLTVEQGGAPQVWSLLSGPRKVRPDAPATFTLLYGNSGNAEADAIPLQIAVPAGFDILFPPVATPPQQSGQVSTDWSKAGFDAQAQQNGKLRNYMFLIPTLPVGTRLSLTFKLIPRNVGEGDQFQMNAEVGVPYYTGSVIDTAILNQIVSGAENYAQNKLVGTISSNAAAKMGIYAANQLALEVQAGRSALASSLSGRPLLYALAQNTQDIAEYGIAQSGGTVSEVSQKISLSAFSNIFVKPMAANPSSSTVPVCSGTVLAEGTSCRDPWGHPPTPKDPLTCALLAGTSLTNAGDECSPTPRKGCPYDPNCSGPSAVVSVDPNGKYGQHGLGDEGYLVSGNPMNYLITFENQPTATAPAATVTITDQLDTSTLDLGTFRFGPLGWGSYKLTPPPGVTSFHGALDLRPDRNVLVDVNASLDTTSGQLKWTFTSLDPVTETPVTAADAGFLPPDTTAPNGEGYVSYSLYPKKPTDGNKVCNEASIVFDTNSAIDTQQWCNIYDDSAPVSKVDALPANETSHSFTVNWSGTDAGPGIATYSIYVSDNGGAFKLWQNTVTTTSATYTGEDGHTYGFYSVATDKLGHAEQKKTADTTTAVGAAAPSATLAPGNLAFGNVKAGETSAAQTLTLTNTGTADLAITSVTLTGVNNNQFTQTSTCGATLAAGGKCTISVVFAPSSVGSYSATLAVADPAGTQSATLTGTGTEAATPKAILSPTDGAFGGVNVGSTSDPKHFVLANGGSADLSITSIGISGANASEFHIAANTCGKTLAPSHSCEIDVTFGPTGAGNAVATLSVVDNAGPQTSTLGGAGTPRPAAPQAALSPASVSFGSTNVGSTSAAHNFTLKNGGNAVLPINSISMSGTNASEFVVSNNTCGSSLAAASSCSIGVLFKPSSAGDATATLSVVDSVGTQTANLSGVGMAVTSADFNITASPAQQSVQRGSTASYTTQLVSADSSNPFLNPVTFTASGLPSGASVAFSPASLVPGADKATTSTMMVTTSALSAELKNSPRRLTGVLSAVASLACVILMWPLRRGPRGLSVLILLLAGLACATGLTACGSNGSGVTPPGSTTTITVTGTSGSTTHATTVTLKVN